MDLKAYFAFINLAAFAALSLWNIAVVFCPQPTTTRLWSGTSNRCHGPLRIPSWPTLLKGRSTTCSGPPRSRTGSPSATTTAWRSCASKAADTRPRKRRSVVFQSWTQYFGPQPTPFTKTRTRSRVNFTNTIGVPHTYSTITWFTFSPTALLHRSSIKHVSALIYFAREVVFSLCTAAVSCLELWAVVSDFYTPWCDFSQTWDYHEGFRCCAFHLFDVWRLTMKVGGRRWPLPRRNM